MKSKKSNKPKKSTQHALLIEWGGLTAGAYGRAGGAGAVVDCVWLDRAEVRVEGEGSFVIAIA